MNQDEEGTDIEELLEYMEEEESTTFNKTETSNSPSVTYSDLPMDSDGDEEQEEKKENDDSNVTEEELFTSDEEQNVIGFHFSIKDR